MLWFCSTLLFIPMVMCGQPTVEELSHLIGYDIELKTIWDTAERQKAEVFWARPTSVEQIQKLVLAAKKFELHVRAVGSKHSWSPIYADNGNIALDLSQLEGKKFTIDKDRMLVSSLASATIEELLKFKTQHGVTIPSVSNVDIPTLQGVTATSAHGSISKEGPTSTFVYGLDLVDSSGRVRHFNDDDDKDVISACKVHVGMCGIIYNTTVKVVQDRVFKFTKADIKVSDLLLNQENRKDFVMNNYGVLLLWKTFSGATEAEIAAKEEDEFKRPPNTWRAANDYTGVWTMNPVEDASITPDKVEFRETIKLKDGTSIQVTSDYRWASESILFPAWVAEVPITLRWNVAWATPESEDFSAGQKTLENYFNVIEANIKRLGVYKDAFGIIRWLSHKEDCTLCHTKMANEFKLMMEIEWTPACRPCNTHFMDESVRDKLWSTQFATGMMSNNSRILPHWGKYYDYIPGMVSLLKENYGSSFDDFIKIRNKAFLDPDNTFMNSHLKDLFHDAIVRNTENTCATQNTAKHEHDEI
ncbi:unnamed protein product [Owenia fusiformis]|uniref:FAD-binding PCMH-type domain-containing protein n=1 Tax=Owenia fusiformis TaxID=6347 RepID=A0A8S4P603_OWEFU|nr:unnamed protein product [Owenia fusiformis]